MKQLHNANNIQSLWLQYQTNKLINFKIFYNSQLLPTIDCCQIFIKLQANIKQYREDNFNNTQSQKQRKQSINQQRQMQQMYEEKIARLQQLLVVNVIEKMYYKKQWNDRKRFLDAGLKIISDKLNGLTIEQNELYNEIVDINDESVPSLQTILEQQEGFETEHHTQIDSYEEMFEDIYKQISLISDTESRLINKYKIELQSMAYEVKQIKLDESQRLLDEQQKNKMYKSIIQQDQQDFQALYNEEKDKLQELEIKFETLQHEFEELQQISQTLTTEKKNENNINEQQIKVNFYKINLIFKIYKCVLQKQNLDTLVKEIKILEEKCIGYENEIKEKNKQLKTLRVCQTSLKQENQKLEEDLQEKLNNKELSEGKQKKMQRELSRLTQIIERKEKEISRLEEKLEEYQIQEKDRVQGYIQEIEELTVENEKQKQEIISLAKSNKVFQTQMKKYENIDQTSKQLADKESQLKELHLQYKSLELKHASLTKDYEVTVAQKDLNYQKIIHEKDNTHKKQLDEIKSSSQQQLLEIQSSYKKDKEKFENEALQYLNYKDEEISKLRKQLNGGSTNSNSQQSSAHKENGQNGISKQQQGITSSSVKDLQNLLIILSKDLRTKEQEIDLLKQQLQYNKQPLQQLSQNRIPTNQSIDSKQQQLYQQKSSSSISIPNNLNSHQKNIQSN